MNINTTDTWAALIILIYPFLHLTSAWESPCIFPCQDVLDVVQRGWIETTAELHFQKGLCGRKELEYIVRDTYLQRH